MEVEVTTAEGLKRELRVVIGAGELGERLSKRLDELKDQVKLKGFRPGKVPVNHLKKVYGRSIMAEVLAEAVDESSKKALTDREERPALQPEISLPEDQAEIDLVMNGDRDLAYVMSFEILPDFELTDFAALSFEKQVAETEDKNIDEGIEQLVEANISYSLKEGEAADGDRVTLDFEGKIDGEAFESGKAEDAAVVLGKGRFIPGFEEGLIGAKAEESRQVETVFPEDYPAENLAGKTATFDVLVKKVDAPVRPEVDENFATMLGLESVEALRDAVKDQLKTELDTASRSKLKRTLLDSLDEVHTFDLPESLVDSEFETIWTQVTGDLERAGRGFSDEGTTEEDARKEYRTIAERRVRLGLVLSKVGESQEIQISEEEVNRALMARLREFPGQEREVYEYYQKTPEALAELRTPIFEDKVVDYILELANVTEKSVSREELFATPEDDDSASAE